MAKVTNSSNPGIREVAAIAGVSVATVSRTLNMPDKVTASTRERVMAAVTELNYIPHSAARALSLQRTHILGAAIPTIDNSIFTRFIQGLQRRAGESGYTVLLASYDFDRDVEWHQVQGLVANGAEAIVLSGEQHHPDLYALLDGKRIPYVNTSIFNPDSPYPCVGYDNAAAAGEACAYLLGLGHKRFAVIANPIDRNDRAATRVAAIRERLHKAGLDLPDSLLRQCPFTIADARAAFRSLMAESPRPTALLCGNDVQGFGALLEAQAMNIKVPGELSIIGFDDLEWASEINPALTTVAIPTDEMGRKAAEYLLARLDGSEPARATLIETALLVRESTGPAPE